MNNDWLLPTLNVVFCGSVAALYLREKRLMSIYWLLATYIGVLMLKDMSAAPILYGRGLVPMLITRNRISGIVSFCFACNVVFLLAERTTYLLIAGRRPVIPIARPGGTLATTLLKLYGFLFVGGVLTFLPFVLHASYDDYVNNRVAPEPALLLFQLSMPFIPLCILERKHRWAAIAAGLAIIPMVTTKVRVFALIAALPAVCILVFREQPALKVHSRVKRRATILAGAVVVGLAVLGTYANYVRTGGVELPEEGLSLGMYHTIELVDRGAPGTGNATVETVLKALAFPIYNRLFFPEYTFPEDPAIHVSQIRMAIPQFSENFQHYPFLWYTDAYLASGFYGVWNGVFWGVLLGVFEGVMAGRRMLTAVLLPSYCWIIYFFFRGAGAQVFHIVSRQLYMQGLLLLLATLYTEWLAERAKLSQTADVGGIA